MPQIKLYTWEEFVANPAFEHYELVAGEPVPLAQALTPVAHGVPHTRLVHALVSHVDATGIGLVTIDRLLTKRGPDTVRVPDIMFATKASLAGVDVWTNDPWPRADLAVEVRSQGQTLTQLGEKMTEFFEAGVREVWVVDWRKQTVTKYEPDFSTHTYIATDVLDGGDMVPGFRYPLAQLFAQPDFG
jgi:Uma2 family endonuclease